MIAAAHRCPTCGADFDQIVPGEGWICPNGHTFTPPKLAEALSNGTATAGTSNIDALKPSWPDPLKPEALHGLPGDIVRTIGPHTESDPVAILAQVLTMFGNRIGSKPHFRVEADRHALKLFVVLVGASSKARKGTSFGRALELFDEVTPSPEGPTLKPTNWARSRVISGLTSGEGLIWGVRDPIHKSEPIKEKGQVVSYQDIMVDAGVDDKRLCVSEPEYGSVIRIMGREGNALSGVLRKAWDTDILSTLTKNSPAVATGAHISVIGHVTDDELRRYLDRTDAASGWGNRHIWLAVKRANVLPDGGRMNPSEIQRLRSLLADAIAFAENLTNGAEQLQRDDTAAKAWRAVYPKLSEGGLGMAGALTSRAEAQVMRIAAIYALMDHSSLIRIEHLRGALALWEYAEASTRWIFGDSLGDPDADAILQALTSNTGGLTREQISSDVFARNRSASQINRALSLLTSRGLAHAIREETDGRGRNAERWLRGPSQ